MPNITSEAIYSAARNILPELNEAMQNTLALMLARADAGEKMDNSIVDLIAGDPVAHEKFRYLIYGEEIFLFNDYSGLAGDLSSPIAEKYYCPRSDCKYIYRIQKVGEIPGKCPIHNTTLVSADKKRGN